ncbi:restriction endonuclease subunit S [Anabaena sp. UHCC 0253]|uniref:restriction endonuclease subunit S n=1 Tax=Anabaena sp. UHCC 0253 TaxID=2590019 RepID=UPI001447739A|nr:restriction endonuclease subunit S [Anabaena sp. UHCC 0253]MTJ56070.1 restriction endonuclease subunit S [Anabaena sp. UHCC 0253]
MTVINNKLSFWMTKTIGDYCLVGDGAHASIKRQPTGIMYLTSKNFKRGGLDLSKVDYISEEDYQKYFRDNSKALTKPQIDDVLFSIIGTIGEPYLYKTQDKFGLSSSVSILRPNKSVIYPKYLYYWINGYIFQDALYSIKGGVAQSYVSLEMIKSLPLYYPPQPTQKKIASILSNYDDLIENNTRRIKILEEMAQTLYNEWFVKFRFPGHEQVKMVESELGLIPEGWEVVKLGDVAQVISGFAFKSTDFKEEGIPIIKIKNIRIGTVDFSDVQYVDDKFLLKLNQKYHVKKGELLISLTGSHLTQPNSVVGRVAINFKGKELSLLNQRAGKIIIKDIYKCSIPYLFYLLSSEEKSRSIALMASGAASQANVSPTQIESLNLILPISKIMNLFYQFISPIFEQISNLEIKNINLRKTRDLLLPKLISGEIDVENLEIDTVEIAA